jgi:antitoxin component of RelBE/YafQ-DinJ toxin-antitoxin module
MSTPSPNFVEPRLNLRLPNVVDAAPSEAAVVVSESKEEPRLPNVVDAAPYEAAVVVSESKEEPRLPNVVDTYVPSSGNNSSASNSAAASRFSRLDNFPEEYDPDRYAAEEEKIAKAKSAAGAGAGAREVAVAKRREVRLMVRPRALNTINVTEEKQIWREFVSSLVEKKKPHVLVISFYVNKPITFGRGSFFIGEATDKVTVTNSGSASITGLADSSIDTLLKTAVGKINDERTITHLCIYINFENNIDYANLNSVVLKVKEIGAKYGIELLASKGEPSSSSGYMKLTATDHANLLFIVQKIAEEKDLPVDANINAIIRTIATRKNVTIMKEERAAIQDFVNKIKGKESSSGANNSSASSAAPVFVPMIENDKIYLRILKNFIGIEREMPEDRRVPLSSELIDLEETLRKRTDNTITVEERKTLKEGLDLHAEKVKEKRGSSGGRRRKSRKSRKTRKARKTKSRKSHRRR